MFPIKKGGILEMSVPPRQARFGCKKVHKNVSYAAVAVLCKGLEISKVVASSILPKTNKQISLISAKASKMWPNE